MVLEYYFYGLPDFVIVSNYSWKEMSSEKGYRMHFAMFYQRWQGSFSPHLSGRKASESSLPLSTWPKLYNAPVDVSLAHTNLGNVHECKGKFMANFVCTPPPNTGCQVIVRDSALLEIYTLKTVPCAMTGAYRRISIPCKMSRDRFLASAFF